MPCWGSCCSACSVPSSPWRHRCSPAASSTRSSASGDAGRVVFLAVVIALIALLEAVAGIAERWQSAKIGEGLILDLRRAVFGHVQRMPIAFFTRTRTGALVSRLNNDVIGAQRAFTWTLSGVVSNVISLVLALGVMLTLSWQITGLALLLLPMFVIPARRMGSRLANLEREAADHNSAMTTQMTERFSAPGATLVKLFGRPAREQAEFGRRAERVAEIGVRTAMGQYVFLTALALVSALALALVYGLGGYMALRGRLEPGTVVTLALLLTQLYAPLTALASARVDAMTAIVSFERVFEVLDPAPLIRESPDAGACRMAPSPSSSTTCASPIPVPTRFRLLLWKKSPRSTLAVVGRCSTACRSASSPARWSPSSAPRAAASRRSPPSCRVFTTSIAVRCVSAASMSATSRSIRSVKRWAWSPRTVTCSTTPCARTSVSLDPTPLTTRCGKRSALPVSPTSSPPCPTGSTRWSASAAASASLATDFTPSAPDFVASTTVFLASVTILFLAISTPARNCEIIYEHVLERVRLNIFP